VSTGVREIHVQMQNILQLQEHHPTLQLCPEESWTAGTIRSSEQVIAVAPAFAIAYLRPLAIAQQSSYLLLA
jgi:hypothetical protein